MLSKIPMWRITCDLCDDDPGGDYWAWSDIGHAEDEAACADWHIEGGKHICPDCIPPAPDEDDDDA